MAIVHQGILSGNSSYSGHVSQFCAYKRLAGEPIKLQILDLPETPKNEPVWKIPVKELQISKFQDRKLK